MKVIDAIRSNGYKTVLDIGTGSGCIACSVAQSTESDITAVDISKEALKVAKDNAKHLNVDRRIKFLESDLFSALKGKKFDVIVSNPPYIPNGLEVQKEVTFEPRSALFTEDDMGLEYYNEIIPESLNHINDGGFLAFEIGFNQGADVYNLMEKYGYKNVMIEKDMMGLDRVVYGIK